MPDVDLIVGAEGYNTPDVVCDIYFSGVRPCLGGLLALDGASGEELWRHYSPHEVFSVNCNQDLDGDLLNDCIAAGRVGVSYKSRTKIILFSIYLSTVHQLCCISIPLMPIINSLPT